MWPHCRELGVAAITYYPLEDVDLSQHPRGEPKHLWAQLASTQKSSLSKVAYEMEKGDIIYVKQGPKIVGRGIVKGPYRFDYEHRLRNPNGLPWAHQIPVEWSSDFEPIDILLGSEPSTVLRLSGERLRRLENALTSRQSVDDESIASPQEIADTATLYEGAKHRRTVSVYERDSEARKRCLAHYGTRCFICGFNFGDVYGEVGEGFIHVHHLTPLSQVGAEYQVDPIRDLRPICPNCHAIVHRRKPAYSVEEVKEFLLRASQG